MLINKIKENNLYKFLKFYNQKQYKNDKINQLDNVLHEIKNKNEIDIVLFHKKNLTIVNANDVENFLKSIDVLNNVFVYDIGEKFLNLLEKEKFLEYKLLDKIQYKSYILYFYKLYSKGNTKNEKV